ncbi:MAG: hypothetical protein SGARI_002942 [Bacillariaceae sp.]
MGRSVFPSPQIKNVIDMSIKHGNISNELAEPWLKRKFETETIEKLKKEASNGNGDSASKVGIIYYFGEYGIGLDREEAGKWFKIAADAGDVTGMAEHGEKLMETGGIDSAACLHGFSLLSRAAGSSSCASLYLGRLYAGKIKPRLSNFPIDNKCAIIFLEQAVRLSRGGCRGGCGDKLKVSEEYEKKCEELLKKLKDEA